MPENDYSAQVARDLVAKYGLTTDNIGDFLYAQIEEEVKALPLTKQFEIWRTSQLSETEIRNLHVNIEFGTAESTLYVLAAELVHAIIVLHVEDPAEA